jgi:hypothetical protein
VPVPLSLVVQDQVEGGQPASELAWKMIGEAPGVVDAEGGVMIGALKALVGRIVMFVRRVVEVRVPSEATTSTHAAPVPVVHRSAGGMNENVVPEPEVESLAVHE